PRRTRRTGSQPAPGRPAGSLPRDARPERTRPRSTRSGRGDPVVAGLALACVVASHERERLPPRPRATAARRTDAGAACQLAGDALGSERPRPSPPLLAVPPRPSVPGGDRRDDLPIRPPAALGRRGPATGRRPAQHRRVGARDGLLAPQPLQRPLPPRVWAH